MTCDLHPLISINAEEYAPIEPLPGDPWVVTSALQKAIRRGEPETAERAALSVLRYRGAGLFRRLLVVAFEDIGIGAPELLTVVTRLCTDTQLRTSLGGSELVSRSLVRALTAAPKDRSADYLICSVITRPDWELYRRAAGSISIGDRISIVGDRSLSLATRATATWFASGMENGDERRIGRGDLEALMEAFVKTGLTRDVLDAVKVAARITKEPIVLMLPLLLQELDRGSRGPVVTHIAVPEAKFAGGIPLFSLDKHTRTGQRAISIFARQNAEVRDVLERYVCEFKHRDAAMLASFYTDASPVALRLDWDRSEELEALGIETDLTLVGVPQDGIQQLLSAFRANLDHLNNLRTQLIGNARDDLDRA